MRELSFQFKDGRWNVVVFVARWKSFLSDQSVCSVCGKGNVLQKSKKRWALNQYHIGIKHLLSWTKEKDSTLLLLLGM